MIFRRRLRSGTGEFDMTPMIDVVFQLIIFFMYTSQFSALTRSPIDLPTEPGEDDTAETSAIVVDLRADGDFLVERDIVSFQRVVEMVRLEAVRLGDPTAVELLIRADRSAEARPLNALASRLAEIGVRNWQLGTARTPAQR